MRILAIETSCDETAISVIDGTRANKFTVRANSLLSQIDVHKEYGGVFPMLAKREHGKNLVPLLLRVVKKSEAQKTGRTKKAGEQPSQNISHEKKLKTILEREPELFKNIMEHVIELPKPKIDFLAVTYGPGLEPALWVGINFAKALSLLWDIPILPINHMEGHIFSALISRKKDSAYTIQNIRHPALALLVSGGHTELILIKGGFRYELVGETRDDAAGEAFDKSARLLSLPYPGGPEISKRAERFRKQKRIPSGRYLLPRPMKNSKDYDFSFSGLKTAVLYMTQKIKRKTEPIKDEVCFEIEEAITDVLIEKTLRALKNFGCSALLIGGGVSANTHIRKSFRVALKKEYPNVFFSVPEKSLSTDNALMIGAVAYARATRKELPKQNSLRTLKAEGTLKLG